MASQLKLLCLDPSGNLWGSERVLLDALPHLKEFNVAVCCPPGTPLVKRVEALGIRALPYFIAGLHKKSRWARLLALLGLARACLAFMPDVMHVNQAGCYRIAHVVARLFRIALVVHVRIYEDAEYLARQRPKRRYLRAIVAISPSVASELRRFEALRQLQIHCVYDCYTSDFPSQAEQTIQPLRKSNQIACVGRIVPIKGQDLLIRAIERLRTEGVRLQCLMIGTGEVFAEQLRRTVSESRLDRMVTWLNFHDAPVRVLRECSLLIVPSHREPLGRVIFEAWDAGCVPLVFRQSGGAADLIAASCGGLVYDEQTPESIAYAIKQAFALEEEEHAELVACGRLWINRYCSPLQHAFELQRIFKQALAA